MTELLLIRHGETDFNRYKKFLGLTDVGLNSEGRGQVLKISKILRGEKIDYLISSDLLRCRETVEILNLPMEVVFTENLREMDFGLWEGLTWKEIFEKYEDEANKWKEDWINTRVPGGGSFTELSKKIMPEIEKLLQSPYEKIAVISHGGCIRAILGHYILDSNEKSWKFQIDNGTISRICLDNKYVYLKSLNEK